MEKNTLKTAKKSVVLCFLCVVLQLALVVALAFAVDMYAWTLLLQSRFGWITALFLGLISVSIAIIVAVSVCKVLKGCLAVKDENKILEAKAFWTEAWGCGIGMLIAFMPYMVGMSVLSGGTLYAPWVWIVFFACFFAWKLWEKTRANAMQTGDWIELGYTLLKTLVLLFMTLLLTNTDAVEKLFVAYSLHDNLAFTYGLLGCVRYALQAIFPFASVWLALGFALDAESVEEERTAKKCTWFVVAITVVDCILCVIDGLGVSSFIGAFLGWLDFARKYFIPVLLLLVALHALRRFPTGAEMCADFNARLSKKNVDE